MIRHGFARRVASVRRHLLQLLLFAFATSAIATAPPSPERSPPLKFVGVLTSAGDARLCLMETANGAPRWLRVGETIGGFTLSSYDAAAETAVLTRHSLELRLRLVDARGPEGGGALSARQVAAIQDNLRLVFAAANVHFREGGSHYVTFSDLVAPGKHLERLTPVAGEDYSGLSLMKGETGRLEVMTAAGVSVSLERSR